MRVFISLLVPFFLIFACVEADYLHSISWQDPTQACDAIEATDSLEAIAVAVAVLTGEINWIQEGGTVLNRERELDEYYCTNTQYSRCSENGCGDEGPNGFCYEMYDCYECGYRRQLIQTETVLDRKLQTSLEDQIANACTAALRIEGQNNDYSASCKTVLTNATCNALITNTSSATELVSSHPVCGNFAVHAGTTITFDGTQSTVYGGDVGVSPGTTITGNGMLRGGKVVADSTVFAADVLVNHTDAIAGHANETSIGIEIGGLTFTPGTYRSDSAINIVHGTNVILDGDGDYLFIAGSTLVTAADTSVILTNGAKVEKVLWALGTAATLGSNSVVEGSILAGTSITFDTLAKLHGCALVKEDVTFAGSGSIFTN
jgi:hypothetical protein